jgi:predicted heme/steroid binding protein/uncharacterized membrane protein
MDRMDREKLSQYDGAEGKPAYVAHEGRIYDVTVSKLWRNGQHMKTHRAGSDLTVGIKTAPHGPEVLERFQAVAELAPERVAAVPGPAMKTPPRLIAFFLGFHPHPMTVHFPIGLCIAASFFSVLSLFADFVFLRQAALYNIVLAAVAAPFTITTGLLSWYYNYSGIWTHIYRMKTLLSILILGLLLSAFVILLTALGGDTAARSGFWYWAYTSIVIALAPAVFGLGYYGGKITFPS